MQNSEHCKPNSRCDSGVIDTFAFPSADPAGSCTVLDIQLGRIFVPVR